nr:hypothetical protein CFP56_53530 [Quercus suber]
MRKMAVSMGDLGNPSNVGNPSNMINSEAVIQGTATEITLINSMSNYSHANVKGSNSINGETGLKKQENGQTCTDLNEGVENVGFNSKPNEG